MAVKGYFRRFDWFTFSIAGALVVVGLLSVASASSSGGGLRVLIPTGTLKKQLVWVFLGALALILLTSFHYRQVLRSAYGLYIVGIILLAVVLVVGRGPGGVRRWIVFGPLRFQPSELVKLIVIITLAKYMSENKDYLRLRGLVTPFLLTLLPVLLIARQPDLGTAFVFLPVLFGMLYLGGARVKHLGLILLMGILSLPALWFVMHDYQKQRVITYFYAGQASRHAQLSNRYQREQAATAIGSGGATGRGLGRGLHRFLPARNTDFIFAVIAQEWGFLGCLVVLGLYALFFFSCGAIAERTREPGGRLLVVGITALVGAQAAINTAMTVGLLPIVGLTLPFISYGGSSLLASFLGLALVLNVSMRHPIVFASERYEMARTMDRMDHT